MADNDSGFNVSVRDVYDEVRTLSTQVNSLLHSQQTEVALLKNDVSDAKKDIEAINAKAEDARKTRVSLQWQMAAVFIGAVFASVIPLVIK